jgi:glycerol-3-phosphate acyltransferase PlsX
MRRFRQRVDYAEHGAAPLLGVDGLALVGHGRSTARAVLNGIATAAALAEANLVKRLAESLAG